jgi:hypothetical protein
MSAGGRMRGAQTYTNAHPETGEVYSGKQVALALQNKMLREEMRARTITRMPKGVRHSSISRRQARTQSEEANSSLSMLTAEHVLEGGTSGNAIDGISRKNPKKPGYIKQAIREFGTSSSKYSSK